MTILNGRKTDEYDGKLNGCPLCEKSPEMNIASISGVTAVSIKCECGLRYSKIGTVQESRKQVVDKAISHWNGGSRHGQIEKT